MDHQLEDYASFGLLTQARMQSFRSSKLKASDSGHASGLLVCPESAYRLQTREFQVLCFQGCA